MSRALPAPKRFEGARTQPSPSLAAHPAQAFRAPGRELKIKVPGGKYPRTNFGPLYAQKRRPFEHVVQIEKRDITGTCQAIKVYVYKRLRALIGIHQGKGRRPYVAGLPAQRFCQEAHESCLAGAYRPAKRNVSRQL